MSAIAFIFARGGSKGLPKKNTRIFCGKPLIAWSIEHALKISRIERVMVSTDSLEIAAIAEQYGAEVPFIRPKKLAQDDAPEWLAWRHALRFLLDSTGTLPDVMISVPPTAPLRTCVDIENCLDEYEKGGADIVISVTDSHRNPFFNMVMKNADGTVSLVNLGGSAVHRRQDSPNVYDITTVCYAVDPKYVLSHHSMFEGRVRAIHVPVEHSIDIDTLLDFQIAEFLFNNKGL